MTLAYQTLYVFLEGDDDERFFEGIIRPIYEEVYDRVQIWKYSQKKKEKVNRYLNSIRNMQASGAADLIIVADLDDSPCVTDRKGRILSGFRSLSAGAGGPSGSRTSTRILIVCREIESWYLAGLNDNECKRMGIPTGLASTDHVSKEQFRSLMPKRFRSEAEFKLELLQVFDQETARAKNSSFKYFMQKYASGEGAYNLP